MQVVDNMKISLTESQKTQLRQLGFKDEEMTPETLVNIKLYEQALHGNVSAINSLRATFTNDDEEDTDDIEDISKEVEQEEKKLIKSYNGLSKEKLELNKELIHNTAFQQVQLRHLSKDIAKNGVKEKYKNGNNQWGWKDRTEVKTYNNMMKSYQSCMKQLNELMDNECGTGGSLADFDLSDD